MSNLPTPLYFTFPKGHKQDKVYKTVIKNNEKCLVVCHDEEEVEKTSLKNEGKRSNHQRVVRTSTADGIYSPKLALKVQDMSEIVAVGLKEWREQEEHALIRNGDYLATDLWQRDQLPRSDNQVGYGSHSEKSRDGGVADYLRNNASFMTAYRVLSRRLSTSGTVADLITAGTTSSNLSESSVVDPGSVAPASFRNDPEVVVDQEAMMSDLIFFEQDVHQQTQDEEGYIDSGYSSFRSLHLLPPQHSLYNPPNPIRYSPFDLYQFSNMETGEISSNLAYLQKNPALWILWLYIVSSFALLVMFGWHRVALGLFWLSLEVCGWLGWVYVGTMIFYIVNLFLEPFDSIFV